MLLADGSGSYRPKLNGSIQTHCEWVNYLNVCLCLKVLSLIIKETEMLTWQLFVLNFLKRLIWKYWYLCLIFLSLSIKNFKISPPPRDASDKKYYCYWLTRVWGENTAVLYILQNTMVVGGWGNGPWGKKIEEGKRKKKKNGLKTQQFSQEGNALEFLIVYLVKLKKNLSNVKLELISGLSVTTP